MMDPAAATAWMVLEAWLVTLRSWNEVGVMTPLTANMPPDVPI